MKIAVITFNDMPPVNYTYKYERLGQMSLENRRIYCEHHGYDFIYDVPVARDRPACWAKIPALLSAFKTHEWVLWADSDTLVFSHAKGIEEYCDPDFDLIVQSHEQFFRLLGIPLDQGLTRMPINTGVFLIRASDWSKAFLESAYTQTQFVTHDEIWDGVGEQEAMIWLLNRNMRDRARIKYVENLQNHPKLYRPGDLFVHFYGNHAVHHLSLAACEDVFRRWEKANSLGAAFPTDIVRFHWCCIQNKQPDNVIVHDDLTHFLYTPQDICENTNQQNA